MPMRSSAVVARSCADLSAVEAALFTLVAAESANENDRVALSCATTDEEVTARLVTKRAVTHRWGKDERTAGLSTISLLSARFLSSTWISRMDERRIDAN